jgi:hypothetical protein
VISSPMKSPTPKRLWPTDGPQLARRKPDQHGVSRINTA